MATLFKEMKSKTDRELAKRTPYGTEPATAGAMPQALAQDSDGCKPWLRRPIGACGK